MFGVRDADGTKVWCLGRVQRARTSSSFGRATKGKRSMSSPPRRRSFQDFPAAAQRKFQRVLLTESGDCLLWTSQTQSQGYGLVAVDVHKERRRWLAHRVAYFLATGVDPGSAVVRHKCDTPLCCNPSHLELGTQQQNIQDAVQRGRTNTTGLQAHRDRRDALMRDRMDRGVAWCNRCSRERPRDQFHRNKANAHGLAYWCKDCGKSERERRALAKRLGIAA